MEKKKNHFIKIAMTLYLSLIHILSDTILKVASSELSFEGLLQWILEHQL